MTTPEQPDCIHQLRECPDCGGLEILRLDRVDGITAGTVNLTDGSTLDLTGATFYVGIADTPCTPEPPRDVAPPA